MTLNSYELAALACIGCGPDDPIDCTGPLLAHGLITQDKSGFNLTERGCVYLNAMCSLPLPVKIEEWRMP